MTTESTSKVHGHWPVKYAVANIKDGGRWVLHVESPVWHAWSSCILHAEEFPLYFTWPLIVTLLRVCHMTNAWSYLLNIADLPSHFPHTGSCNMTGYDRLSNCWHGAMFAMPWSSLNTRGRKAFMRDDKSGLKNDILSNSLRPVMEYYLVNQEAGQISHGI